jgi:hypothetical protein
MNETLLIDFSWSKPTPAAVKAAGHVGVLGYVSHDRTGKNLSPPQARAYRAAGLVVGLILEDGSGRAKAGKTAGVADRKFAEEQARALGYPHGCVLLYAVDFDATGAEVLPYFRGVASAQSEYGWGPYGSDKVIDAVAPLNPDAAWQCEAWSGTRISSHAHLYQRIGHTVPLIKGTKGSSYDEDVVLKRIPLWGGAVAPPTEKPTAAGWAVPVAAALRLVTRHANHRVRPLTPRARTMAVAGIKALTRAANLR